MNIEDIFNIIKIEMLYDRLAELDHNDPNFSDDVEKAYISYYSYLLDQFGQRPMHECLAIFFLNFNVNAKHASEVFIESNEKMLRSALLFFELCGVDAKGLKNNYLKAIEKPLYYLEFNGQGNNRRNLDRKEALKDIAKRVSFCLKEIPDEEIDRMTEEDFIEFSNNFDKIYKVFLDNDITVTLPTKVDMIECIYGSEFTKDNLELLDKIYNEVLLKVDCLKSFDYNCIFAINPFLMADIKGMYRHMNKVTFDGYFGKKSPKDLQDGLINDICKHNIDDEEGLKWFLSNVNDRAVKKRRVDRYLTKHNKYYKDFKENNKYLYDNVVISLLTGKLDIDEKLLENLGFQEAFLANYDEFFKMFMTTDNKELQKALLLPLTVGLIEKQNDKYDLDIGVYLSHSQLREKSFGVYLHADKSIYINPMYLDNSDDYILLFANAADTVFHETRHAKQYDEMENRDDFDYSLLLMSMDSILSVKESRSGYYTTNYLDISFERDAVSKAHEDFVEFFKDYPDIKSKTVGLDKSTNEFPDYIREEDNNGKITYFTVVDKFMENINSAIQNFRACNAESIVDDYLEQFDCHPVIKNFFDIDKNGIMPKSEEYFMEKIKEFESIEDKEERDRKIGSIKQFLFSFELSNKLKEMGQEESVSHTK